MSGTYLFPGQTSAFGAEHALPGGLASQVTLMVKNPPTNSGDIRDVSSVPGWGRSSEVENGNPLQYSCQENPMDRGAWKVYGVTESNTTEASEHTHVFLTESLCCTHEANTIF